MSLQTTPANCQTDKFNWAQNTGNWKWIFRAFNVSFWRFHTRSLVSGDRSSAAYGQRRGFKVKAGFPLNFSLSKIYDTPRRTELQFLRIRVGYWVALSHFPDKQILEASFKWLLLRLFSFYCGAACRLSQWQSRVKVTEILSNFGFFKVSST
jgi:hypothetical protein